MNEISKPKNYTPGRIECIDAMIGERGGKDFYRASILQYLWRCFDKGDALTDLKKARWHLNRLIAELEKETA